MVSTIIFTALAALAGLAAGTYQIYANRTRAWALRILAGIMVVGCLWILAAIHPSVWVVVGYLAGTAASYIVCDRILDLIGVREPGEPESDA